MQNEQLLKYKNPVLIKDEEGKVRQTIYDLPSEKHAYGKKIPDDPEPIKYVINGWENSNLSVDPASKNKNYQELNRMAASNGLFNAKQQTEFRKHHDIMVQTKKGGKVIPIMLPEENFTYGVSNRPSTPIKLVVGNCYGLEQEERNSTLYQQTAGGNKSKLSSKKTKSQLLREEKSCKFKESNNKPLFEDQFKMNKFTQSGATRINTNLKPFMSAAQNLLGNSESSQPME